MEPNRNSGAKNHIKRHEKFTRGVQQKIFRQKNQQTWRQENWNYWVWGTQSKKNEGSEQSLSNLWDTTKQTNILLWEFNKENRERKGQKNIWGNNGPDISNLAKDMNLQIQKLHKLQVGQTQGNPHWDSL